MSYKFISGMIDIWHKTCNTHERSAIMPTKNRHPIVGAYGGYTMSEDTTKREILYHAPVIEFDNKHTLITNIGYTAKADEKFQIAWPVPTTDEEAQTRYECPLADLVEAGIRQLSTRPDYKAVGFDEDGNLKPDGHLAMQTLADGYKVGQRAVAGASVKVMAQKAKKAEADLGMTLEQMVAKMQEMKEAGMLD